MLANVDSLFVNSSTKSNIDPDEPDESLIQDPDFDKVNITLQQIVRDWTDAGQTERDQCYKLIISEIQDHFNVADMQKNQFKVVR